MYSICQVISQDHMIKGSCLFIKYPDKFSDHRFCENGDLMLLICNLTSRDQNLKGLCAFMVANLSQ